PSAEEQTITITGATGGTFRVRTSTSGEWSANVAYNASASTLETALEGILGAGNVDVTGSNGGPWTIEFGGTLANQDVPQLIADASSLTGTSQATATATVIVESRGRWHVDDP